MYDTATAGANALSVPVTRTCEPGSGACVHATRAAAVATIRPPQTSYSTSHASLHPKKPKRQPESSTCPGPRMLDLRQPGALRGEDGDPELIRLVRPQVADVKSRCRRQRAEPEARRICTTTPSRSSRLRRSARTRPRPWTTVARVHSRCISIRLSASLKNARCRNIARSVNAGRVELAVQAGEHVQVERGGDPGAIVIRPREGPHILPPVDTEHEGAAVTDGLAHTSKKRGRIGRIEIADRRPREKRQTAHVGWQRGQVDALRA